jgi:DNA polymerase elongation subunit (family B)
LTQPRILIIDVETAPKIAYVWRFWKENISPKQVKQHGHIMSFAAKWLGEPEVFYVENRKEDDTFIVSQLCSLLDEADMAVAHNGEQFDFKQIRARALVHGIKPPSPFKVIDTLKIAKREFGFPSNSLEYLTTILGTKKKKTSHKAYPGFELWLACLRGDDAAWAEMKAYNIDDVLSLEELYLKLRPWDTAHPSLVPYAGNPLEEPVCPKCGSKHLQKRGFAYTGVGKYHRLQCQGCGGWSRSRFTLNKKDENALVNQAN